MTCLETKTIALMQPTDAVISSFERDRLGEALLNEAPGMTDTRPRCEFLNLGLQHLVFLDAIDKCI